MSIQTITWDDAITLWTSSGLLFITSNDEKFMFIKTKLIKTMFPVLQDTDQELLLDNLVLLINFIYIKFGFTKETGNSFWNQLIQNDLLDLRALVGLMLPYINDDATDKKKHSLHALSDIYTETDSTGRYKYSNMQYNRCIRNIKNQTDSTIEIKFRPFILEYFINHMNLLLMSIESVSNALHVNWMDILPITMDAYKETTLYTTTKQKIQNRSDTNLVHGYTDIYPGLSYQNMYNVITNHLYHEIVDYKWLLYELKIGSNLVSILSYIEDNGIFQFDNIWNQLSWSQIASVDRTKFGMDWTRLLKSTKREDNLIVYYLYTFFITKHLNRNKLLKDGVLIDTIHDELTQNDDDNGSLNVTHQDIDNAMRGIAHVPAEEIYVFLYHQLLSFKKSWYYYFLKIKKQVYLSTTQSIQITAKNIYNFAKLISTYTSNNEFLELPKQWNSLNPTDIDVFMKKILFVDPNAIWFNINNYIRAFFGIPDDELRKYNLIIHEEIYQNLIDIIFESMIYHGLLSAYVPNDKITDLIGLSQRIGTNDDRKITAEKLSQMKQTVFHGNKKQKFNDHAYYFITGSSYGKLPPIKSKKYYNTKYQKQYLDWMETDSDWQFRYAMNWISQMNFYHHYINVRVIYATGATGTGKSTIIPRLLMYCQHMIDYNITGKIICTQPRVSPTVSNAITIATESGVPIIGYNKVYDKDFPTSEYHIQYKHSNGDHIDQNAKSFLKIVTDGTLLEELKKTPFLSRVKKIPTNDWEKTYTSGNKYDIIIIDEAHEHNANMDAILTLARDACYVNNSLKLVIISATMDDDEPIYRRYYRNINDNRAFPLSQYIIHAKLDRANMDRRVDISIPRQTTRYPIKDVYLTKEESDKINEKNFVGYAIRKTIDIVKHTTDGDILLFMTGKRDIDESVNEINLKTPSHVIAFPFLGSELSEEQRNFIINIHTTLKTYTRYKSDVDLSEDQVRRRVPMGTYTRAIIVATNVAEASISLQNLRYVVDAGYAKVNMYYPLHGTTELITMPISNTSSMQRRGRVGRVAAGEVYYMYDDTKVRDIKTSYKIADSNVTDLIVDLLKNNPHDYPIISEYNNINSLKNLWDVRETNRPGVLYSILKNPYVYEDIITKQYMYGDATLLDTKLLYTYYGIGDLKNVNLSSNDYLITQHDDYHFQYYEIFDSRCHTGYEDTRLADDQADFYIIHPDENIITRNMYTGKIDGLTLCNNRSQLSQDKYCYYFMKKNDLDIYSDVPHIDFDHIKLPKYDIMMHDAKLLSKVIQVPPNLMEPTITMPSTYKEFMQNYFKQHEYDVNLRTQFSVRIETIKHVIDMDIMNDPNNILWYVYSLSYMMEDDIVGMICLVHNMEQPKKMADAKIKNPMDIKRFVGLYATESGDITALWKLWLRIKGYLRKYNLFSMITIDETRMTKFKSLVSQYLLTHPMDPDEYITIEKMYQSGKLNTRDEYYHYISKLQYDFTDLVKNTAIITMIDIISKDYLLNKSNLQKFIVEYFTNLFQIEKRKWIYQYKIDHNMMEEDESTENAIQWAEKLDILPDTSSKEHIMMDSYLMAYSTNVLHDEHTYYILMSSGIQIILSDWSLRMKQRDTFLTHFSEYIVYHHTADVAGMIAAYYLTPVTLAQIMKLNPIYYYYYLFDTSSTLQYLSDTDHYNKIKKLIRNNQDKFNLTYLIRYLGKINDPLLNNIIMHDINTKKN